MKIKKITPNLMVADVRRAVSFYRDVCGFASVMALRDDGKTIDQAPVDGADYVFVIMSREGVEVMVQEEKNLRSELEGEAKTRPAGLSCTYYVEVEGVDAFHAWMSARSAQWVRSAPRTSWYGMREFTVADPDGNVLMFAESVRT
jgi:uncharacterized glyoxalase superfamily protein PhnB